MKALDDKEVELFDKLGLDINNLHILDFDSRKYVRCTPVKSLKYDLVQYELVDNDYNTNTNTNTNANRYIITCKDSYRLTDEPDNSMIDSLISTNEWRYEIKTGSELDFYSDQKLENPWIKTHVLWFKNTPIKKILSLANRNSLDLIGYFHIESIRIQPFCTYTDILTQDTILEEQIKKNKIIEKIRWDRQFIKFTISMLPKIIKFRAIQRFGKNIARFVDIKEQRIGYFYDPQPCFNMLKMNDHDFTDLDIFNILKKKGDNRNVSFLTEIEKMNIYLDYHRNAYNAVHHQIEIKLSKFAASNYFENQSNNMKNNYEIIDISNKNDSIYNIRILHTKYDPGTRITLTINNISLIDAVFYPYESNPSTGYYQFQDFTIANHLVLPFGGTKNFQIIVKNLKSGNINPVITFTSVIMNHNMHNLIKSLPDWGISHINSTRSLIMCHPTDGLYFNIGLKNVTYQKNPEFNLPRDLIKNSINPNKI